MPCRMLCRACRPKQRAIQVVFRAMPYFCHVTIFVFHLMSKLSEPWYPCRVGTSLNSGKPEFQKFGLPDFGIWNSGVPELWTSGFIPKLRISGIAHMWNSGSPDFPNSGVPDFQNFENHKFRKSRFPELWKSGNPDFRNSRNSRCPEIWSSDNLNRTESRVPWISR